MASKNVVIRFNRIGVGISNTDVEYADSTSSSTAPASGWQTNAPAWQNGHYIWTRTHIYYTNGNEKLSEPVCLPSGKGIAKIEEWYYLSSSATSLAGGSWVKDKAPTWKNGYYIWTKSVITYTDGTSSSTSPICTAGNKGDKGDKGDKGEKGDTGDLTADTMNALCANAFKGNKCSKTAILDDISPLEHNLSVKVKSKNLIPFPYYFQTTYTENPFVLNGITFTVNSDGSVTANGTNTSESAWSIRIFDLSATFPWGKGKYLIYGVTGGSYTTYGMNCSIYAANGYPSKWYLRYKNIYDDSYEINNDGPILINVTEDGGVRVGVDITIRAKAVLDNVVFKPMVIKSETPEEYVPYLSDLSGVTLNVKNSDGTFNTNYTPLSDGTVSEVIKSKYPKTELTVNNDRAVVDVTYNKDANKVIKNLEEKLTNAIIALGGNI